MDLEAFVARLALNPAFREEFLNDPESTLATVGIELTPPEVKVLVRVGDVLEEHGGFDIEGEELAGIAGTGTGGGTGN